MGLADRALALTTRADVARTETRYSADQWLSEYLIPSYEQFGFGGNTYTVPLGVNGLRQTMAGYRAQEITQTLPGYSQALKGCPPAFAAQLVRAMVISQARFTFRNLPSSGTPRRTFGTRALGVLEHPAPSVTTGEMLARMEWHAGLAGNAFVYRQPDRLRVLRPDWVIIVFGSEQEPEDAAFALDGKLIGFVYCNGGFGSGNKPQTLLPKEVAHWCPLPDPEFSHVGMSWITPAIREIQGDRAASEHKLRFFANGATPNLVVKGIPAITKDQFDEIVDAMESRHAGVANAYRTLYLTAGADATVVGADLKQVDFKATVGSGETRISFLSRVPAPILGISEGLAGSSLNAGNFGMARRLFADTWVYPTLQDLAGSLADIVDVPNDAELWFDTVDMPLLREDAKDAAEIVNMQITGITMAVREGFTAESSVSAAVAQDVSLLKHTGLTSVQLQKPGMDPGSDGGSGGADPTADGIAAGIDQFLSGGEGTRSRFNPAEHPRNPKGSAGGGRFRSVAQRVVDALQEWSKGDKSGDPFAEFTDREPLRKVAVARGLTFRRGASRDEIAKALKADLLEHLDGKDLPEADRPAKKAAPRKVAKPSAPTLSDDPDVRAVQVENKVREAYVAARKPSSDWVMLSDLRDELGDLDRAEVDEALKRLERQDGVNIVPQSNQKALGQRDRDAAVRIGGQDKHAITIDDPSPRPLPTKAPAKKAAPPAAKPDLDKLRELDDPEAIRDALDLHTVPELKDMLRGQRLPLSGRKRDLVDRLVEQIAPGKADKPSVSEESKPKILRAPSTSLTTVEQERIRRLIRSDPQIHATVHDRFGRVSTSGNLSEEDAAWLQGVYERDRVFVEHEAQKASVDRAIGDAAKKAGQTPSAYRAATAGRLKDLLADKPIAVRVRDEAALREILSGGRFKTQFEGAKRAPGLGGDIAHRRLGEQVVFGVAPDAPVEDRPIYGYVALNGIEPALSAGRKVPGIAQPEGQEDVLSSYGKVQVVLKPQVRARTTATVGDSLDEIGMMRPSPVDNPTAESAPRGVDGQWGPLSDPEWTRRRYVEAQIHGGVRVEDIAEVVFPEPPSAALAKQLDDAGIPHRVLGPGTGKPSIPEAPKKATPAKPTREPAKPTPARDLFTADDATVEAALKDVFEGQFGPYTTKATVKVTRAGTRVDKKGREHKIEPKIDIEGEIFDADGTKIGKFGRSIAPAELSYRDADGNEVVRREVWAEHHVVQLGEGDYAEDSTKYHGTGFGGEFNRRAIDWYRASGVHGISQDDQNGYVWASQGFDFRGGVMPEYKADDLRDLIGRLRAGKTQDKYDEPIPEQLRNAPNLDAQLSAAEELLARLASTQPGQPGYPTAYEVSQLGRRPGQRGRAETWLGKYLKVPADEMILNPDEGEVIR